MTTRALSLRIAAILCGLSLLVGPAGPARGAAPPDLASRLDEVLASPALRGAGVGAAVLDGANGRVLYGNEAETPRVPASNQKLLVTATALARLGPDAELTTRVLGLGPRRGDALEGDLLVRGGGDPTISGRFFDGSGTAVLDAWVAQLHALGIRRIAGDVIGDGRLFSGRRVHPGWPRDQLHRWYAAPVSALALQDNCLDLVVSAGPSSGAPAVVETEPPTEAVPLENRMTTTGGRGDHLIVVDRRPGREEVLVRGEFWRGASPYHTEVTVHDPVLYFARVLAERLEAGGIEVAGEARRATEDDPREGEVLVRRSQALLPVLAVINKRSQNLHAEMLLKLLGARVEGEGTREAGGEVVRAWIAGAAGEEAAERTTVADGSGLARANRVAPLDLVRVLDAVGDGPHGAAFRASLAVGGVDGSLARRFTSGRTRRRVLAKTGTLSGVSALSGFALRPDGGVRIFSILTDGVRSVADARRVQDRFVEALLR